MSGYYLNITPVKAGEEASEFAPAFRVRYSMPGLGFGCEAVVSESTAELLRIAIEEGKRQMRAAVKDLLEVK